MHGILSRSQKTIFFNNCLGVFQGGGCRAAALVGAYEEALSRGVHFSEVAGTSAGAIVAAFIAAGASPSQLAEKMATLDFRTFMSDRGNRSGFLAAASRVFSKKMSTYLDVYKKKGVYSSSPIEIFVEKNLREFLKLNRTVKFSDLHIPVHIVAADLISREVRTWCNETCPNESVSKAVRASCSIPFFFQPVDEKYVDGGVLSNLPLFIFSRKARAPAARRILAFSLEADAHDGGKMENGWDLLERVQQTIVDGAQKIQEDAIPTSKIVINTGDVKATDFMKIDKKTVGDLMEKGRDSCRKFFENERINIKEARWQSSVIAGRHELLTTVVEYTGDDVNQVLIKERDSKFVWDLFPSIVKWIESGVSVNVLLPDHSVYSGNEGSRERQRRNLLICLGAHLAVKSKSEDYTEERSYIFTTSSGASETAIVAQCDKLHDSESEATLYRGRLNEAVIGLLKDNFITAFSAANVKSINGKSISFSTGDETALIKRIRNVRQYSKANVSLEFVPLAKIRALTTYVHEYKYRQIPYLLEVYKKLNVPAFKAANIELCNGRTSPITPPVVEAIGEEYFLIEGTTRAKFLWNHDEEGMYCLVIRDVVEELPGDPVPLERVRIVSFTVRDKERYGAKFNYDHFRKIEEAAHIAEDSVCEFLFRSEEGVT